MDIIVQWTPLYVLTMMEFNFAKRHINNDNFHSPSFPETGGRADFPARTKNYFKLAWCRIQAYARNGA